MTDKREMTALDAPVGAGAEQSSELTPTIIPDYGENFNPSAEEMFEAQMQYEQEMQAQAQAESESAPGFMQTVSMPELYEMVYPGKPPIIDHFLYPGTSLFVGAPQVGKSIMSARELRCGTIPFARVRCCISLWRTITADCRSACIECSERKQHRIFSFQLLPSR